MERLRWEAQFTNAIVARSPAKPPTFIEQQATEIRRLTEVAQDWCRDARHNESVVDEWKRQYEKEHERAESSWQVRDTCARAEQAGAGEGRGARSHTTPTEQRNLR